MSTYVQEFDMDEPQCMRLLRAVDGFLYSDAAIEVVASNKRHRAWRAHGVEGDTNQDHRQKMFDALLATWW
jgi:hypothetical protein